MRIITKNNVFNIYLKVSKTNASTVSIVTHSLISFTTLILIILSILLILSVFIMEILLLRKEKCSFFKTKYSNEVNNKKILRKYKNYESRNVCCF